MRLEDKRKVLQVLMCVQNPGLIIHDAAERLGLSRAGRLTALACKHREDVQRELLIRGLYGWGDDAFDETCVEAAYRLIESSATLRREWFGR